MCACVNERDTKRERERDRKRERERESYNADPSQLRHLGLTLLGIGAIV